MNRKVVLEILTEHFNVKPKYLGAPTFVYELTVGNENYTIDQEGNITNTTGEEVILKDLLEPQSTEPEETAPQEVEETLLSIDAQALIDQAEVTLPLGDHTVYTLRNIINMIASKQALIQQAFNLKKVIAEEDFIKALNERPIVMFADFEIIEDQIGSDKCPGIAFDFNLKTITFKFYEGELEPDKLKAYMDLVTLINANALKQKHASWKPTKTDNPKYTFRTWLLRLGMIGDEYKTSRKVLLANLEGNSAFKNGAPAKKEVAAHE